VATGPWEDKATSITGLWTGGDLNPCSGGTITNDPSYPTTGSFTISIDGGDVRLVRMPTGYGYKFKAKGVVLSGGDGSGNPDLTITDISVPTGIGPGMTANIVVTYKNIGSSDAGPFKLYGYAFPSKDYKKGYESDPVAVQGLKAGKTGSINIPIHVPSSAPAGTFDIKVAIDNSNYADSGDVIEANENNNEKWRVKVSGPETNSDTMSSQTLCEEDPTSPECSAALGCSWESFTPDPGAFAAQPGGVFPLRENDFAAGSYLVLVGPAGKDGLGLPPATWRTFGPYDLRSGHKYKATIELSGRSLGFEEDPADLLLYSDPRGFARVYARNNCFGDIWYAICLQPYVAQPPNEVANSTILLFDASGSMGDNNKIGNAKSAANSFLTKVQPEDEVALIVFYDCDSIVVEVPFTTDKSALTSKIDAIEPSGSTPLYAAMNFAKEYMNQHAQGKTKKSFNSPMA